MQRISSWTSLVTALGRFRYGTVTGGVPPTPLKAEWLNMVQEEIVNVILGAGLELSVDEEKQLLLAIQALQEDQLNQVIQPLIDDCLPLAGGTLTGGLKATKGVRSAKGVPSLGNASAVGYAFGSDSDTGLFATAGTDIGGSELVLMVDSVEVARWSASGALTIPAGLTLAGGETPYHTGNKPSMLALVYPVGSIYFNASNATSPAELFGFGIWAALAPGRMLIGAGSGSDARGEVRGFDLGEQGGEYNHVLSEDEMPEHTHGSPQGSPTPVMGGPYSYSSGDDVTTLASSSPPSGSAGGNVAHNNLPPYLAVHMWQRTA